jgi:hypothetical protein
MKEKAICFDNLLGVRKQAYIDYPCDILDCNNIGPKAAIFHRRWKDHSNMGLESQQSYFGLQLHSPSQQH